MIRQLFLLTACAALSFSAFAKTAKAKTPPPEQNWRETAVRELTPKETDWSKGAMASPATVLTTQTAVQSPIVYTGLQVGLGAQMYRPSGRMRVIGLNDYDTATLGSQPMTQLQMRWLPWTVSALGNAGVGFYGGLGYAQHPVTLHGATGESIGKTRIHSTLALAGASAEWPLPIKNLTGGIDLGVGRLNQIQASVVSAANVSEQVWMSNAGLALRYRFGAAGVGLAYDKRMKISKNDQGLVPQENNWTVGLLYGFR